MDIRLPQMPFRFKTPDGLMEVTVRCGVAPDGGEIKHLYAAAAAFIGHGPRALERIQLTPNAKTYREVMKTLVTGFRVNPAGQEKGSLRERVLTALCSADGVKAADD